MDAVGKLKHLAEGCHFMVSAGFEPLTFGFRGGRSTIELQLFAIELNGQFNPLSGKIERSLEELSGTR